MWTEITRRKYGREKLRYASGAESSSELWLKSKLRLGRDFALLESVLAWPLIVASLHWTLFRTEDLLGRWCPARSAMIKTIGEAIDLLPQQDCFTLDCLPRRSCSLRCEMAEPERERGFNCYRQRGSEGYGTASLNGFISV